MRIKGQSISLKLVKANLLWASIGPLLVAFLLNIFHSRELFILKDAVFYLSIPLFFLLVRSYSLAKYLLLVIAFLVYLVLVTFLFFELKPWQVYNIRQLLAPLLILGISYNLKLNQKNTELAVSYGYKIITLIIVLGAGFMLFDFWSYFSLKNYFTLKGIPVDPIGVSYMFYEPIIGYKQRMVSTFLDPINLGHTIAAFFILGYYKVLLSGRKRQLYLLIFLIGLALTFSKGAILQVVLALFLFNKNFNLLFRIIVPSLFVLSVLLLVNLNGILIHLHGLSNSIIHMNFLGHGLGMVGNYAKMFSNDLAVYNQLQISDTFIGSVLGQIGLIGLLLWLGFFYRHFIAVFFNKVNNAGSIIIISQVVVSILSENTLNFTSFIIPGLIGGVVYNYQRNYTMFKNANNN